MIAPHADTTFPANLYTPEGELLAEGESCIRLEEKAINFSSDFVPLYPIGTPLIIERIYNGHAVHRFFGKVFLSSKEHMRLTDTTDMLLPGAEYLYCGKMAFPATLTTSTCPIVSHRFHVPLFQKNRFTSRAYPALIIELTDKRLECQLDLQPQDADAFTDQQFFLLNPLGSIPLPPTQIVVEKAYLFGNLSSCIFRFDQLDPDAKTTLHQYLVNRMQKNYKLF